MPERRNWKRHAAELAVIVIGVLIALATDGWNDDRLERRTEATYLERLAADVRSDTATLAFVIRLSERKDAALQRVDRVLYQDQRASIDTLAFINDVVVGAVFASAWPFVTEGTFEDLLATGNLALIRDTELRGQVSSYYLSAERTDERLRGRPSPYSDLALSLVPYKNFNLNAEAPTDVLELRSTRSQISIVRSIRASGLEQFMVSELNRADYMIRLTRPVLANARALLTALQESRATR